MKIVLTVFLNQGLNSFANFGALKINFYRVNWSVRAITITGYLMTWICVRQRRNFSFITLLPALAILFLNHIFVDVHSVSWCWLETHVTLAFLDGKSQLSLIEFNWFISITIKLAISTQKILGSQLSEKLTVIELIKVTKSTTRFSWAWGFCAFYQFSSTIIINLSGST